MGPGDTAVPAPRRRVSWWRRLSRRTLVVGAVAVLALATGTGIAVASIPSWRS